VHDLNPYADDSLQLVMTLTKPDGTTTLKWGFFMREAKWNSGNQLARLTEDHTASLHPYHVRFRFAPDMEGPWQFNISVKAPYTSTTSGASLPAISLTGFSLHCAPRLPDNRGPLSVDPNNRRTLWFGDIEPQEPFFALGVNMADIRHGNFGANAQPFPQFGWFKFFRRDMDQFTNSFSLLHDAGGNFARVWLMPNIFAPEYVNLGVYDKYHIFPVCSNGLGVEHISSGQFQSWAFDQLVDRARSSNIYLQVCFEPSTPGIAYEMYQWGQHPYVSNFVEPSRNPDGIYDVKRFFYRDGDMNTVGPDLSCESGDVFYYWKRKLKYMMSRWGYSVNLPILEPFNETNQMLTYRHQDLRNGQEGLCIENHLDWPPDPYLPHTINKWVSDISRYVRGTVDPDDPQGSFLGESSKLFLMSYTDSETATIGDEPNGPLNIPQFLPFTNPDVDLIDVHRAQYPDLLNEANAVDARTYDFVEHTAKFWDAYPGGNGPKKPFNQGEAQHYTYFEIPNPIPGLPPTFEFGPPIEGIFHNYDVSFHNELWASAFSGKFAAGTTWHWERVFWWPDALPPPPFDLFNQEQIGPFTSALGGINSLDIGLGEPIEIPNRRIHHHFRPLADLLNRPSVVELGIFNDHFTAKNFFDDDDSDGINELEAYYLLSDWSTAIGWVHNRNASVAKSFYVRSVPDDQNFLGCTTPTATSITLSGFFSLHAHYITWFPTRIGSTVLPPDTEDPEPLMSTVDGDLVIDLTGQFNGIADNYLDTLRSDYAFVITPQPFFKMLNQPDVHVEPTVDWDFSLYPNPTRDLLTLGFSDEAAKEVILLDVSGRRVWLDQNITTVTTQVPTSQFAKGVYWVYVATADGRKVKKVIIH
jgi:hypothetical protein